MKPIKRGTGARAPRTVRWGLALLFSLIVPVGLEGQQDHRTQAESSRFTQHTAYDSMMAFLRDVQGSSTEMRVGTYGTSHEGRELPYAAFSRPAVTQPWEAWALGKPILVLAAGVHGPERTLRESLLILTRDLATPGTPMNAALDDLTILVVPQINPDGFSRQPSPQRGNLWGLDLNRDYMKLEQPEIQGYVQNVLLRWMPHLLVDGHNGGSYPYHINYQCPSHATPDQRITVLCDEEIFPAIDSKLEEEGYRSWYYQAGTETRWDVGGSDPRIGRNYGGFANMVAILFESPGGQDMFDGVRSGLLAYEAVIEWAQNHPELLRETVHEARRETVELGAGPIGEIPIEVEYEPEDRTVEYWIALEGGEEREIIEVRSDSLMKRPVTTHSRPRPWAYVVPRDAERAVELLHRHRIQVERLQEPAELTVDQYTIAGIGYEAIYNHAAATKVEVHETVTRRVTIPAGSYIVRTGQMQGRIAAHLLEAETRDGVTYWSYLDPWLPKVELERFLQGESSERPVFPIYKVMTPTPLPTRLLE